MWDDSNVDTNVHVRVVDEHTDSDSSKTLKVIRVFLTFIFFWQSCFHLSDVGVNMILGFFVTFLLLLAKVLCISSLEKFSLNIPKTISAARQFMGYNRDDFEKWVTCRHCSSIYNLEDYREKLHNGTYISKKCSYISFPNHTHHNRQKPCNSILLKSVKTSAGTILLQKYLELFERIFAKTKFFFPL